MTSAIRLALLGLLATGGLLLAAGPETTDIRGQTFSSSTTGDETTSVCTGDVVVTSGDLRITCDYLKAVSVAAAGAAGQPRFRYLLARGRVHIVQGNVDATCRQAEVLPVEGKMTLTGDPVVTDRGKGMTFTADPLVRWRDGRMEGTGFRARAASLKDLGLDAKPGPAAPAAAPAPAR